MISQASPVSTPKAPPSVATKAENVLTTDQLVKIYGGRAVVDGVNMHVGAGEIVGLLGPNGAGKTTSFYMIVGLVRPNSGRVIFSDTDVTDYPMYKRARLGMGYLPQEESIFRKMTVEQNILAILETLPLSKAERRNRCDQLLHQFGIERIAKNVAQPLQRVARRRLRQPDPHRGAADIGFAQQRIECDQQVEIKRIQIHGTNIYHISYRLEECQHWRHDWQQPINGAMP